MDDEKDTMSYRSLSSQKKYTSLILTVKLLIEPLKFGLNYDFNQSKKTYTNSSYTLSVNIQVQII